MQCDRKAMFSMTPVGRRFFSSFIPRTRFKIDTSVQWFPGHMHKGLRDMGKVLKRTDCIIEVHDARIPFSGRNIGLVKKLAANKPLILVLNKADLIDPQLREPIKARLWQEMQRNQLRVEEIFFIDSIAANAKSAGYNQQLLDAIIRVIQGSSVPIYQDDIINNMEPSYNLLVMGIPNVGKSTVINRLRNVYLKRAGKATTTGALAGVTRSVLERIKICDYPKKIYLFDTPGILEPSFNRFRNNRDHETFMSCALCGTMSDQVVGKELIADYLLYWLNKHSNFGYVEFLGLPGPTNDINEALAYAAIKFDHFQLVRDMDTGQQIRVPHFIELADKFIWQFRKGHFGRVCLDIDFILNTEYPDNKFLRS